MWRFVVIKFPLPGQIYLCVNNLDQSLKLNNKKDPPKTSSPIRTAKILGNKIGRVLLLKRDRDGERESKGIGLACLADELQLANDRQTDRL